MNPEKYNPKDILKNYAKNSVEGKRSLKENKINVVPSKEHWDKMWRDGESTALFFTESSKERINSEVSIIPGKILVVFNSPLTVNKETTQRFDKFNVEIDSEMYDLLFISSSVIDYESSLGDSASELYLQYYPNLRIEKIKLDEGTKIYKVGNVVTKEEFKFASRSLSWPAGYGLEGQ